MTVLASALSDFGDGLKFLVQSDTSNYGDTQVGGPHEVLRLLGLHLELGQRQFDGLREAADQLASGHVRRLRLEDEFDRAADRARGDHDPPARVHGVASRWIR